MTASAIERVAVVGSANSRIRQQRKHKFSPSVEVATAEFIWFDTTYHFDSLTFLYQGNPHGTFAVGLEHTLTDVDYASVVAMPGKIFCIAVNYRTHIRGWGSICPNTQQYSPNSPTHYSACNATCAWPCRSR